MTQRKYWIIQCGLVALVAAIFVLPHLLHWIWTDHQGLLRLISTDDGYYQAHIRAALLGRWSEVTNGMTGGSPAVEGAAPALFELIAGALFSWTSLKAAEVMLLLTVFVTPFIVMLMAGLLRTVFKDDRIAILGSAAYVLVFLSTLQKPVNMSLSLPFMILCLLMLTKIWTKPRVWMVIVTGILLGMLPSTYFWSWTFVWAVGGILLLLDLATSPRSSAKNRRVFALFGALAIGFLISLPALINLATASKEPFFIETALRSTLVHSRGVESVPRTILLLVLAVTSIILVLRSGGSATSAATSADAGVTELQLREKMSGGWLFPLATLFAAVICMYQNLIHGVILTFSSHYYPFVCLAALLIGLWSMKHGKNIDWLRWIVVSLASIFLIAGLYDYRAAWDIARGDYYLRNIQHLRPALEFLDDAQRETVLTDRTTAHMVTTWTDDDVLFTAYVKHLKMSDSEYAERYCLTELFNPSGPDIEWLAKEVMEWPTDEEFARRKKQFADVCDPIRKSPDQYLKKYNVMKLLWNEKLRPEWRIDQTKFVKVEEGEGWSMFEKR